MTPCNELIERIIPVIHGASSVQKLLEGVRVSLGFGLKTIVVTRASGAAAQQGIPEAFRLVLKSGASLVVLSDLRDVIELFNPENVFLLGSKGEPLPNEVKGRTLFVIHAGDQPFTQGELSLGRSIRVIARDVGSTAFLALALARVLGGCVEW